jgi:hypothetical protein
MNTEEDYGIEEFLVSKKFWGGRQQWLGKFKQEGEFVYITLDKGVVILGTGDYRKRSRKDYDLDEIRAMYGTSGAMNSNGATKFEKTGA